MMKKWICILLSLLLAAAAFSGCAKKDKPAEQSNYKLKFSYDAAYSDYDESAVNAYQTLCAAFCNYEDSVRMNASLTDAVLQLYETSFPLYVLASASVSSDGTGVTLNYVYPKEEHLQRVKDFSDTVEQIVNDCYAGTLNKTVYTLNAYRYVCEHYTEAEGKNVYETVMNNTGNQFTYSGMFEFLLQQADIPAYHVIGISRYDGTVALTQAELDGKLYYFDTALEAITSKGKLLRYFGMCSSDLDGQGIDNLSYTSKADTQSATDLRFDTCRNSTGWEIKGSSLMVSIGSDTAVEIPL